MPTFNAKVRSIDAQIQIFDVFRRKYVLLTPEEWVRQHYAQFLVNTLNYPLTRLHLEFQIKYYGKAMRPDIAVLNNMGATDIVVECKAPHIVLNEDVFLQVSAYYNVLKPRFFIMTNGLQHIVAKTQRNGLNFVYIEALPAYQ